MGRSPLHSRIMPLAASEGQRHDRFADDIPLYGPPTDSVPGRDHNGDIEISAGQKMLSAMSGSLLTSLDWYVSFLDAHYIFLSYAYKTAVTPLDVVRVRLQSQPNPSPLAAIQRLASSSPQPFTTPSPNLGVTACCREVFLHKQLCRVLRCWHEIWRIGK